MTKKGLNFDILTGVLAVFVVFLMTASTFIGAAQDGTKKVDDGLVQLEKERLPINQDAEETTFAWVFERDQNTKTDKTSTAAVDLTVSGGYPEAIVPSEEAGKSGSRHHDPDSGWQLCSRRCHSTNRGSRHNPALCQWRPGCSHPGWRLCY